MRSLALLSCTILAVAALGACSAAGGAAPTTSAPTTAPSAAPTTEPVPQSTTQVITAPPSPSREMTDGIGDEVVNGIVIDVTQAVMETTTKVGNHDEVRGGRVVGMHDATDPRVTGRTALDFSVDWYTTGGVVWATQTITNDKGTWTGPCTGMSAKRGQLGPFTCWLAGTGAYEGWTYYVVSPSTGSLTPESIGYIFEGAAPTR